MICGKCGRTLEKDERFCAECGTPVPTAEAEEALNTVETDNPAAEVPSMEEVSVPDAEEGSSVSETPVVEEESSVSNPVVFCGSCGAEMSADAVVCPMCGEQHGELPGKKLPDFKKFFKKSTIIAVAAVLVVVIAGWSIYPYAKNAMMKLFLSPEKYFSHVVSDNADEIAETVASSFATSKDYITSGVGAEAGVTVKVGKGLENLLSDLDVYDAMEYIDWFESASISIATNNKDNVTGVNLGAKLNGVDFGDADMIVDMNESATYFGLPDYASEYIGGDMDTNAGMAYMALSSDEATEMIQQIMEVLPNERLTKKLILNYVKAVAQSAHTVDEGSETITANGVSQKVTRLALDVDGALVKNVAINVMTELRDDDELREIVDEIAAITDADADELWDELDYAIDEFEDLDEEDFYMPDISFELYVNAKGEIVGFAVDADGAVVEAYTAEKGSKFGSIISFKSGYINGALEGGGKISGDKRSGEFVLEAMGVEVANITINKLDSKKLKEGIFNGAITVKCSEEVSDMLAYEMGAGSEAAELLANSAITVKSATKSAEDLDYTVSVAYQEEDCVELSMKAKTKNPKKVKVPSDYADMNDYEEMQTWAESFDFDKLIDKLYDAKVPDEIVEQVEDVVDYL